MDIDLVLRRLGLQPLGVPLTGAGARRGADLQRQTLDPRRLTENVPQKAIRVFGEELASGMFIVNDPSGLHHGRVDPFLLCDTRSVGIGAGGEHRNVTVWMSLC